jgi:hypothetical protein
MIGVLDDTGPAATVDSLAKLIQLDKYDRRGWTQNPL